MNWNDVIKKKAGYNTDQLNQVNIDSEYAPKIKVQGGEEGETKWMDVTAESVPEIIAWLQKFLFVGTPPGGKEASVKKADMDLAEEIEILKGKTIQDVVVRDKPQGIFDLELDKGTYRIYRGSWYMLPDEYDRQDREANKRIAEEVPDEQYESGAEKDVAETTFMNIGDEEIEKEMLPDYLYASIWSSSDEEGNDLDSEYNIDNFDDNAVEKSKKDLKEFVIQAGSLIEEAMVNKVGYTLGSIAHDFWLTRNGHGAGFWDRGIGEVGDKLTEIAEKFGEVNVFESDEAEKLIIE